MEILPVIELSSLDDDIHVKTQETSQNADVDI